MSVLNALGAVIIDCADNSRWPSSTGRPPAGRSVTATTTSSTSATDPPQLALQRIEGYRPPAWPGPAKHAHLDFAVTDVEVAVKELLALGASRPDTQPGEGEWTVLIDPAGHPFCIAAGD